MRHEKMTFPNEDGEQLSAILNLPEDEKPLAYAIFAHCFTCGKNNLAAAHIARALSRRRIAVLRFDFTGLGESQGDFARTSFSHNLSDLRAAARYLETEHQAPALLIGHSLGGTAVLHVAAELPSAKAVVAIASPFAPRHALKLFGDAQAEIAQRGEARVEIGGRFFTIRKDFLADVESRDSRERLARLKAALLILHSPRDTIVAIDNAREIYQAARHPKSFVSLDPADHLLTDKEDARYAAEIIATWALRYLDLAEESERRPAALDNRVTARTGTQGFRTEIFAGGYSLIADEPESYGGEGLGPSPYDLLQAALGACTTMTLQMYARRKQWPLQSAVVRLRHEKIHARDCASCEEQNGKIDRFERELELQGDLSAEQRQRLLDIAERCPVHKTLHGEVEILTRLRDGEGKENEDP
ncbi:bifunctional alpha/beta hydrolase/OsmC family protein [Geoalkalibacter sp.]|uniref:bifunctional alpha/beta hydrolase/OsmC family protein n=1 Tax=Geoalkalibacter sp. TaxID=3041440 RepID=UPI00272DF201|nr:bifunctional alpha/beta hydrolase/OsmC family protein [Geoalkalibacter sp.]